MMVDFSESFPHLRKLDRLCWSTLAELPLILWMKKRKRRKKKKKKTMRAFEHPSSAPQSGQRQLMAVETWSSRSLFLTPPCTSIWASGISIVANFWRQALLGEFQMLQIFMGFRVLLCWLVNVLPRYSKVESTRGSEQNILDFNYFITRFTWWSFLLRHSSQVRQPQHIGLPMILGYTG